MAASRIERRIRGTPPPHPEFESPGGCSAASEWSPLSWSKPRARLASGGRDRADPVAVPALDLNHSGDSLDSALKLTRATTPGEGSSASLEAHRLETQLMVETHELETRVIKERFAAEMDAIRRSAERHEQAALELGRAKAKAMADALRARNLERHGEWRAAHPACAAEEDRLERNARAMATEERRQELLLGCVAPSAALLLAACVLGLVVKA